MLCLPPGGRFQVDESLDLTPHTVVETSTAVHVDKTVADPLSRCNRVSNFIQKIKRSFNAIFCTDLTRSKCLRNLLRMVGQNVGGLLRRDQYHVSTVAPEHFLRCSFNLLDKDPGIPVIEQDSAFSTLDSYQAPSIETFGTCRGRNNGLSFLEILENLNQVGRLSDTVVSSTASAPDKVQSLSKCLISQGLCGINDEFSIATNRDETTVAIVLEHLGVHFTGSQVSRNHGKAFSIRHGIFTSSHQTLDCRRLDVIVAGPDDLASRIHGRDGII